MPQRPLIESSDALPCDYTRAAEYDSMVSDRDIEVPMRDGVNIAIDVYRPDALGKFPALLAFAIYTPTP